MPSSTPSNQLIQGDIAITDNEYVIHRGGNGKVQSYYWSTGGWTHGWIDNSSPGHLVSSSCGALSTIDNGQFVLSLKSSISLIPAMIRETQ